MPTTVRNAKSEKEETIRCIGKIAKAPEEHVGKQSGKPFYRFSIVVSDGFGSESWVNATMFPELRSQVPEELFRVGAYAKFIGKGTTRPYTGKDGAERISQDLLVNGIELQNGTFLKGLREKEPGQNEDAPF